MSAPQPTGAAAIARRRLSGVAFLVVIGLLVTLTVLLYNKAFTGTVDVTLKADRIGNQLSAPADVKLRGVVVGEVRGVRATAEGADIDLALKPERVKDIPDNVTAQLLPKTLFGEKYVLLSTTDQPTAGRLQDGDVIPQDRSKTALETQTVLDDLLPVLQSLKPAELSTTLNALSTALRGRGDQLGANLARTAAYLRQVNPSVPALGTDLGLLSRVTGEVSQTVPDLVRVLDNLSAVSRNLVSERADLDRFLVSTRAFAGSAQAVVAENETRLVQLASASRKPLELFARYSPEFPCFLKGLARYNAIVEKTFGGGQDGLHITLELTQDNGGYAPGQEPEYKDTRAPYCDGLPTPPVPAGDTSFDDGYRTSTTPSSDPAKASAMIKAVSAPFLGLTAAQVPDLASVLLGPLAEGNQVGIA